MGKADENKKLKLEKLLNTSFELFTSQGLAKTTISDIVEKAGVAKGTFYLYFKDKYDIRNRLIAHKSSQLFMQAYESMEAKGITGFENRLIYMMDHVLDELAANKGLLAFIYKDLSWAVFKKALTTPMATDDVDFGKVYRKMIDEAELNFSDPEMMLFLIIELVGSTGYSSIMYNDPVPLKDLKPHLEQTVHSIIAQFTVSKGNTPSKKSKKAAGS